MEGITIENKIKEIKRTFDEILKYPKLIEMIYESLDKEIISSEDGDQWISLDGASKIIYALAIAYQDIAVDENEYEFESYYNKIYEIDDEKTNDDYIYFTDFPPLSGDNLYLKFLDT